MDWPHASALLLICVAGAADAVAPVTHVLVGDWSDAADLRVLATALAHQRTQGAGRLLLVDARAATSAPDAPLALVQHAVAAVAQWATDSHGGVRRPRHREAARVLEAAVQAALGEAPPTLDAVIARLEPPARDSDALVAAAAATDPTAWRARQGELYAALLAGLPVPNVAELPSDPNDPVNVYAAQLHALAYGGTRGPVLVTNGRVLVPVPTDGTFDGADLLTWERYEVANRAQPILDAVTALPFAAVPAEARTNDHYSNILAATVAALGSDGRMRYAVPRNPVPRPDGSRVPSITMASGADVDAALVHVVMTVDPLSTEAQRQSAMALLLRELAGVRVTVHLLPPYPGQAELAELPVRRYYRMALAPHPSFDGDGHLVPTAVHVKGLPADLLLTLGMEVPQPWLIECTAAVHDLDNLQLTTDRTQWVHAGYRIKRLLVEGHAADSATGWAPRGLQLVLGSPRHPHTADTLVMWNLGYFQLQAEPGVWTMRLHAGRSARIYGFAARPGEPPVGPTPAPADLVRPVVLDSFRGSLIFPKFTKRPGREREYLVVADDTSGAGAAATGDPAGEDSTVRYGTLAGSRSAGRPCFRLPPC